MQRRRIALAVILAALGAQPAAAAAAPEGATLLLSRPSGLGALPSSGVHDSFTESNRTVSADGRFVVFGSVADGMAPGGEGLIQHTFVRDRVNDTTTLVSKTSSGEPANGDSFNAAISADGSAVVFSSTGTNLSTLDEGGDIHVFVHTLASGATSLVDREGGLLFSQIGNDNAGSPSISANGDKIAFTSGATNLGDDANATDDVFIRDISGVPDTRLISRETGAGGAVGTEDSDNAAISGDGDRVAFTSDEELDGDDTNTFEDVYVRDESNDTTLLVSRATSGTDPVGNEESDSPALNNDGSRIAFRSEATNFDNGDTTPIRDIHVRNTGTGVTTLASRADGVNGASGNGEAGEPTIDASGNLVAFTTEATNLDPAPPDTAYVAMRNISGTSTSIVSRGSGPGGDVFGAETPSLGADGSTVVFSSNNADETAARPGDFDRVYARTLSGSEPTELVSRPTGNDPFESVINNSTISGSGRAVSSDGRFVVFTSRADGFFAGPDDDFAQQVYRRDLVTGETILISRASGDGPPGNLTSRGGSVSGDGNRVTFESDATNLVGSDANGDDTDVFVRDVAAGTTTLASVSSDGAQGNNSSRRPALSADGNRLAFSSTAANLTGDDPSSDSDIFVRDLAAGTTTLASSGNGLAQNPAIDADGTVVAFETAANDLDPVDVTNDFDVYVRDLAAGTTTLASRADGGGASPNINTGAPTLDGSGNRVAFHLTSGDLGEGDGPDFDAFVRDLPSQDTILVSRADGPGGAPGDNDSDSPSISLDGNRVAFLSSADNLGPGASGHTEAFVRDLGTGTTTLVSRADGPGGAASNGEAQIAHPNAAGGCVAFTSVANNLVTDGYPTADFQQVYMRAVTGECPVPGPVPPGGGGAGGASSAGPGGDQPVVIPDGIAPGLLAARVTNTRFRVGSGDTPIAAGRRRTPTGTRFTWRVTEAVTVLIRVEQALPGRRSGRRCVKPTRRNRRARKCTRFKRVVVLSRKAAAGDGGTPFSGRIRRKALRPGVYRAVVGAEDAADNKSANRTLKFRIVRR